MTTLIFDIEANGLLKTVDKLWCIVTKDIISNGKLTHKEFHPQLLEETDILIGHNIIQYDLPVLKKLYGWSPKPYVKIVDTLILSRMLYPGLRQSHSLASWGKDLNFSKGEIKDFSYFQSEMIPYCENDVELTHKLYDILQSRKQELNIFNIETAIESKMEFAQIMALQEENGFTLDVKKAETLYQLLKDEHEILNKELLQKMPQLKKQDHYNKVKKEGRLISENETSYSYTQGKNNKLYKKEFKFEEANPNSRQQLVKWLCSLGWKPSVKSLKGGIKLDEKVLKTINIPEAQNLSRMFRIQKQLGMIKDGEQSWLNTVDSDGKVRGQIHVNAAVTGRSSHSNPNLAQVDRKDKRMREVWIAKEGWKLIGCDAKSLEARILAHYLAAYDNGAFAHTVVNTPDIHEYNRVMMGLNERDNAKTANYAMAYGAGHRKLGLSVAKDKGIANPGDHLLMKLGKNLKDSVFENFTGYKELSEDLTTKIRQRGYLFSLSGRPLYPRKEYSALNTLIQGAAADIMEKAVTNFYFYTTDYIGKRYNFVGNIHDEILIECEPEHAEFLKDRLIKCLQLTTDQFKLKCKMDAEAKIGNNWSEVH